MGEVVEHRVELVPSPASDLQVGGSGLPELVRGGSAVLELVGSLDHHAGERVDHLNGLGQSPLPPSRRASSASTSSSLPDLTMNQKPSFSKITRNFSWVLTENSLVRWLTQKRG
jgi:hypothetical protein